MPEGSGYRIYGAYKGNGSIAVSFDALGNGFVNDPRGRVLFSHHRELGGYYNETRTGARRLGWGSQGGKDAPATLRQDIEISLDENLGFKYDHRRHRAEVYFSSGGVRHRFVQGGGNRPLAPEEAASGLFAKKKAARVPPKTESESLASIRATVANLPISPARCPAGTG